MIYYEYLITIQSNNGYQVSDAPWSSSTAEFPSLGGQNGAAANGASPWGPKK